MKISDDMREHAVTLLTEATAKDVVCEKGHKTSGKAIGGAYEVLVDPSWESQDSEPLPEWIRHVNQLTQEVLRP